VITARTPASRWQLLLLGLGVILFGTQLFALDPTRTVFQYNIQTWNRQNGLPFNRISSIVQTPDGYLWMGTQNGLVRFDGVEFSRTAIPNRVGWRSTSVASLRPSPRGGFWFGLDEGAFGYFDGTNQFRSYTADWILPQMYVHGVQEDPDGSIFVASRLGIGGFIGGKTNQSFSNGDLGEVRALFEDPQHRVWFGTDAKGLFYWEAGKLKKFPNNDLNGSIRALSMDQKGRLWVGTSFGLRCYDRNFQRDDPFPVFNEIKTLLSDSHGTMWIGTTGDGLIRYANGEASYIRKTNGLAENYVSSLFEDREGSLWVGTRDGLSQISDLKFPTASTMNGLLDDPVHGVCASTNGGVWCATSVGVYNYKDKSVFFLNEPTNANHYVKRVLEARDGDVYVLDGSREVQIYSNQTCVARYSNGEWPTALAEDAHGVVVGIGAHLYRVSRTGLTPFPFKDPAPRFLWFRNLVGCRDGSLLVASVNGLFRISDEKIEHWTAAEGLTDQDVSCVTEDDEGTLWLGQVAGLTRIKNNKVSAIHLDVTDTSINAIVPDNIGNLWMACNTGVLRISSRGLNDFADGKTSQLDYRLFDSVDALRTIDLTEVEAVGCKTADGKIWLPGPLGVVQIDPAHIPINPIPPPVYIEKILLNGIPQSGVSGISIRRGRGELTFQYTALNFIASPRIHFRYKLSGFDPDWIDAGTQRSALYANLKPGKYVFHVQACNVDGVWNTRGAQFAVELPPEFYQTSWFQIVSGASIILALLGIYAWRTRRLREKEKTLRAANELLDHNIQTRTRELAEKSNVLRTLIDHLPDAVFVKDTEGRVIIDNVAHARYLGFDDPAKTIGKTDFDCFPREKAEQFRSAEIALLQDGKEFNGEENLTLANGDTCWFYTTKVPLRDDHGQIIGLAGINRDITERKKWEAELESLHRQLMETSRHAGMAEVATSVLHNVGNVLNSVNVSASMIGEQVRDSNLERLGKVIQLLQENRSNLGGFFNQTEKGPKLISYLEVLFNMLKTERAGIQKELHALTKNVEHIKKIVTMQQSYAKIAGVIEIVSPVELLEDSLRMHEAAFHRHAIKLVRYYAEVPKISVDRHKVIQILVNLLSNAKYACDANPPANRTIQVRVVSAGANRVRLEVIDNGMGIPVENLTRIFSYGFTTRKNGHGFGLHGGALSAKELGGSLHVKSDGPGKGSAFILELPVEHKISSRHHPEQLKAPSEEVAVGSEA
jgi:PAS domain S-box-containing protein